MPPLVKSSCGRHGRRRCGNTSHSEGDSQRLLAWVSKRLIAFDEVTAAAATARQRLLGGLEGLAMASRA